MPAVAYEALTTSVTHNNILELLTDFTANIHPTTIQGRRAIADAMISIQSGMTFLKQWRDSHMPPRTMAVDRDDDITPDFIAGFKAISDGITKLRSVVVGKYHDDDRDIVLADQLRNLRLDLQPLVNFQIIHTYPKMGLQTFIDAFGNTDLRVLVNLGSGRHLMNQLWRTHQTGNPIHSFCGVAFVSATLTDLPPHVQKYSWFKKMIGFEPIKGDEAVELLPLPQKRHQHQHGRMNEAMVSRMVSSNRREQSAIHD